jgi:hypothetical protein
MQSELQKAIDDLALEYVAEFVPQSQSRNRDEKDPSLNWKVKITRGGQTLETDYTQGVGHLPGYNFGLSKKYDYREHVTQAAEKGVWSASLANQTNGLLWGAKKLAPPPLADVLYSLASDADVLDHPTFESWASDFGYDADSRKAEATYRACLEIALKLRAMIGDAKLADLREAFQDY